MYSTLYMSDCHPICLPVCPSTSLSVFCLLTWTTTGGVHQDILHPSIRLTVSLHPQKVHTAGHFTGHPRQLHPFLENLDPLLLMVKGIDRTGITRLIFSMKNGIQLNSTGFSRNKGLQVLYSLMQKQKTLFSQRTLETEICVPCQDEELVSHDLKKITV